MNFDCCCQVNTVTFNIILIGINVRIEFYPLLLFSNFQTNYYIFITAFSIIINSYIETFSYRSTILDSFVKASCINIIRNNKIHVIYRKILFFNSPMFQFYITYISLDNYCFIFIKGIF